MSKTYFAHAICFFLCSLGTSAAADDAYSEDFIYFESQTGAPLKLSIFQEIPGFRQSLARLDESRNLIDRADEWTSMSGTDVWVFFLEDDSNASFLPEFILDILNLHYDGSPAWSAIATISIDGEPREQLMFFVFLDKFRESDFAAVGCDTATLLYSQLKRNEIEDVERLQMECLVR
ncbi:hypothetical protein MWU60_13090 [Yoonia sp. F2084L]|uniref:hypothetical protein n=1 Tax=Yoonia sp. F2084L TaxID=2926419 RepID=UPI001FF27D63|nr:hypothetical protein [Yoonia sp. F2084L]MCK0096512.1 hypothetical protein [Yoonia sp. F2084L]